MRANYEQLVKAHQRAPQVQEDLVPDEVKFQVNISCPFHHLPCLIISGVPNLHGFPVPIVQSASEHEQLRRAVGVRVQLDRGAVQAGGPAGTDM